MQKRGEKRGQVTLFIIIAILVIGMVALIYFLIPKAETSSVFNPENPNSFIQNCLEDEVDSVVSTLSSQGGSLEPDFYFTYNNINIEYLCYTNEPVPALCVVQQPLLKQHIESEIENAISDEVETCFTNLQENYRINGYDVQLTSGVIKAELLPKRIVVSLSDYILTETKGETVRYDAFNVILNNNLYELISIVKSIIEWEATVGGADVENYKRLYSDLDVSKNNRDDGTRIYVLTDLNTEDKFQFASRSFVFRPGH